MLISVTQVRTGMILQIDGALFRVMKTHHVAPGNVRGAMQTTMRNLATGSKVEKRLRTNDRVERVTVESQDMEYLYADGDEYVFMHPKLTSRSTCTRICWKTACRTCCPTPGRPSTCSRAPSSASPCRPRWT